MRSYQMSSRCCLLRTSKYDGVLIGIQAVLVYFALKMTSGGIATL
jgi:hypothetical protein